MPQAKINEKFAEFKENIKETITKLPQSASSAFAEDRIDHKNFSASANSILYRALKGLIHLPALAFDFVVIFPLLLIYTAKFIVELPEIAEENSRLHKALSIVFTLPRIAIGIVMLITAIALGIIETAINKITEVIWSSLKAVGNYISSKFSKEPEFKFTSEAVANSLQEEFLADNSSTLEPPVAPEKQQSKSCADIMDPLCWFHKKGTVPAVSQPQSTDNGNSDTCSTGGPGI